MIRFLNALLVLLLFACNVFANELAEVRFVSTPYVDDDGQLQLEVDLTNYSRSPIQAMRVHYREFSENHFKTRRMSPEGLRYLASVDLSSYKGGMVEYYLDVEFADGRRTSYPATAPESELLTVAANQGFDSGDGQIVVVSPEAGERIYTNEFVLTVSFFQIASQVDGERTKLFLNNWDVSRYVKMYDEFLTFSPRQVPPGSHKITLKLFDRSGRQVASKVWQFTASERATIEKKVAPSTGLLWTGNVFAENRFESLADGFREDRYTKAGIRLNASTNSINFGTRLYFSNREDDALQPINRYSVWFRSNFWDKRFLRLAGGDVYPQYGALILQNTRVRGFHGQLHMKFLNLDFTTGATRRGIEGIVDSTTTVGVNDTLPGSFQRNLTGVRISTGNRDYFQWGVSGVRGSDDIASIRKGLRPQEAAAAGTDLYVASKDNKIILEGSFNLSFLNTDIGNGEDTALDTLRNLGIDIPEGAYNFASRFLTVNQYLIVFPGIAFDGTARFNFIKNNRLTVSYKSVSDEYNSFGQPYLLRDNRGFAITDNIRLLQNQLFLNLRFQQYRNNLNDNKPGTTDNRTLSFNLSYFPIRNLPSISVGFTNYDRKNDIDPDSTFGFVEDNRSNTINFSTSVPFAVSSLNNRLSLNLINYNRTDNTDLGSENLSNTVQFELNTRYSFPLRTRLSFSFQQTENTIDFNNSKAELALNTFGLGLEYRFNQLFALGDALVLATNARLGSVGNKISSDLQIADSEVDYNRTSFNGRLIYTMPAAGRISFNADMINYSGDRQFKDFLITARYDITF
ncbi:MAG: hypothetical protein ACRBF0_21895 [Calditrichia bacterium]